MQKKILSVLEPIEEKIKLNTEINNNLTEVYQMEQLSGTVENIIYENAENGYTVCDISSDSQLFTLTGYMPNLVEGERISAFGMWKFHKEYGEQFNVQFYERLLPETENEIELYLGSGVLPHVGKATARKIVEMFGKDSLNVIENRPQQLTAIKGLSQKKVDEIYKKFLEQMGLREIIMFFQRFGVSPTLAVKAYKLFGDTTIDSTSQNPFALTVIDGFTFKICDKISDSLGLAKDSPSRIAAGIRSVLLNAGFVSSHTFLPISSLVAQAKAFLDVDSQRIEDSISSLALNGELIIENTDDYDVVYLSVFYEAERNVAQRLREMSGMIYSVDMFEMENLISAAEEETGIILAEAQREAVIGVFENSAMVITGGPGTGKTTIINAIIKIMERQGKSIALAAPTGRAAKRMSEVCGIEAKTIHRLLENTPDSTDGVSHFAKNENNKLDCDILIVDEMSMVDILLMNSLLAALPARARLIMVGDCDQLPSVGAGNVLRDIITSESIACIRLTEIFRQARESMIVVNAHRINHGEEPYLNDPDNDFFMVKCNDPDTLCETIVDLCQSRIPNKYHFDSMSQIQVLTPTRKTAIGVQNLNMLLQQRLNPPSRHKEEKPSGKCTFRIGDKVMQIKNNYNLEWTRIDNGEAGTGVFNGEVGFVTEISTYNKSLTVTFDDKIAAYDFLSLDELDLAYAITVHKSQGSEFDVVIMPMFDTHQLLMTRNLLYTAVTRAKKLVILVGKEEILKQFIDNNNIQRRFSGLREKLIIR